MGVKYVKDFSFPSSGGFHTGSVQRYAKGGHVTKMPAKAKDSAKGMPARAKPNAPAKGAPKMESKPTMGKGQGYKSGGRVPGREMDRLPVKKPPGRGKDLARAKPFKGKYEGYERGGPVAEITPSDGMSPLEEMAYALPYSDKMYSEEYDSPPELMDRSAMDDAHTRMTEMNRQLAKLLAQENAPAGPPGMMAPVTGSAPKMDPGAIQRLTPRKEYGINLPSPDREYRQLPVGSGDLLYAGGGGHDRLNPPSMDDGMVYAGGGGHDRLNPSEPPMLRDAGPGDDFGGYFQPGKGSVPSPKYKQSEGLSLLPSDMRSRAAQLPARINASRAAMEERGDMNRDMRLRSGMRSKPGMARRAAPSRMRVPEPVRRPAVTPFELPPELLATAFKKGGAVKGEKIAKVMREYKEGKLHSGSKKGPKVTNPKQAMAIAMSEAGKMKKAEGGEVFSDENLAYGNKKGPYRGSPKKGRELGRQDRMRRGRDQRALDKARHAEKYAPGMSLDMPDEPMSRYEKGGSVKKAVHKHERAMHPGKPLTKLKRGGVPAHGRKPMYGGGKC